MPPKCRLHRSPTVRRWGNSPGGGPRYRLIKRLRLVERAGAANGVEGHVGRPDGDGESGWAVVVVAGGQGRGGQPAGQRAEKQAAVRRARAALTRTRRAIAQQRATLIRPSGVAISTDANRPGAAASRSGMRSSHAGSWPTGHRSQLM